MDNDAYSYYGILSGNKPIRSLSEDLVIESKKNMTEQLRDMEDRIKRHVTECKREVIKELISLIKVTETKNADSTIKPRSSKKSK